MTEQRYDISRLSASTVQRTPQGGAKIPARLTRTGIFVYRNPDGSVRREFRSDTEVSKAQSLGTLQDAPVIEGHPDLVRPDNYRDLQRGHVSGLPSFDGHYVEAPLVVQDSETLAKIDAGDLAELSCGYTCDIDKTPGTFDGQPYDCSQINISYNHVGLGPKNWGRAGSDVALRLDSSTYVDEVNMKKIKLDSKEFEVAPELFEALDKELDTVRKDCAAKVAAADTAAGTSAGQALTEKTRADKAEADLAQVRADAKALGDSFGAAVEARTTLVESAHKVLGNTTPFVREDGTLKTDREIMVEVVTACKADFKADGRSDDYVRALFEHAVESGVRADSIMGLPGRLDAMRAKETPKGDPEPDDDDRKDAWQAPLTHSKDKASK